MISATFLYSIFTAEYSLRRDVAAERVFNSQSLGLDFASIRDEAGWCFNVPGSGHCHVDTEKNTSASRRQLFLVS